MIQESSISNSYFRLEIFVFENLFFKGQVIIINQQIEHNFSAYEKHPLTKVTPSQIDQLQQISKQTFSETFAESNTEENLQNYLEKNLSKEKLLEELANNDSQFYFAETDDRIAGYLKVN